MYPLAPQGVFSTIQGEGVLMGEPMVFVRFAGCPVGCQECDTDYSLATRTDLDGLVRRVVECDDTPMRWVWLTGGEPTIHDLPPLCERLHRLGYRVAVATAGINPVQLGASRVRDHGAAFVSVSPHKVDTSWVLRRGDQLNFVPGLNGLDWHAMDGLDLSGFSHKFITPMRADMVRGCVDWLRSRPGWRLGIQAHKVWGLK